MKKHPLRFFSQLCIHLAFLMVSFQSLAQGIEMMPGQVVEIDGALYDVIDEVICPPEPEAAQAGL